MIMQTPKIDLYPHNQETYDRIIEMWQTSNRVAVIQATGTGKTYLMLRCMVDFEPSNKVVLAPSNYILDQLLSKANGNLPNTELLTYAKLAFMTKEEIALLNPSLIVLDEFHRCGADKWELGVDMLIKMFPNAKILGTSATPIRYLDNARDMSDELFEGNIAVNLSLSDAIVKGILPMPKYISALYTFDEEINNLQAKIERSKNDEETKKEYLKEVESLKNKLDKSKGIPEIFKKHISDVGGKFIVFCKDKQHLNEMEPTVIEWFKKAKIGKSVEKYRVITGELENNKEFSSFRENKNFQNVRLLFSVDMLNEGVHIDDVTGVILLRPTISPIIFYQQIGRATQVGNTKTPVIFDFVNNFNNLRVNTFIGDIKESIERELGARKTVESSENEILEFIIIDEMKEVIGFFNDLNDQILPDWDFMFKSLEEHINKFGTLKIKKSKEYNSLKQWCDYQRKSIIKENLPIEKIKKLESIGFSLDPNEEAWIAMFKELEKSTVNNIKIDRQKNKKLYEWCNSQRVFFHKNTLSSKRIDRLKSIGFAFDLSEYNWNKSYESLVNFKNETGHCKVPFVYVIDDINLGIWVRRQRALFAEGGLSIDKVNLLNKLNFVWSLRNRNKEDKPNE